MGSAAETVAACQRKISDFSCTQSNPRCQIQYVQNYRLSDRNFIGGKTLSKRYYNKIIKTKLQNKEIFWMDSSQARLDTLLPHSWSSRHSFFSFSKQDHLMMKNSTGSSNHLRQGFPKKGCCSFGFCPNYLPLPPI